MASDGGKQPSPARAGGRGWGRDPPGRGQIEEMFSVNLATGEIWARTWRGAALAEQAP